MEKAIPIFAVAAIFAFLAKQCQKTSTLEQNMHGPATAIISHYSDHESVTHYYVTLNVEGQVYKGKSVGYSDSAVHYEQGDAVSVMYYFTKAGWPRVVILDKRLRPISESDKIIGKWLSVISTGFFVLAVYLLFI